jgi:hypothetical protein
MYSITNVSATTHKKNKQSIKFIPRTSLFHNLCHCFHNPHKSDPTLMNDRRQNIGWFSLFKKR